MKLNTSYLIIAILLFAIEALIAIFLETGFIRYTFGDFLVVILIHTFVKSFFDANPFKLAIAVLIFAFAIEFSQYFHILKIFNLENNKIAKLVLGSTFQISDLVAYTLGILTVIIVEFKLQKS
ncbi:DUF2809 domain-containing protein [Flavobacteriaceae bacterium SZ-1-7]|uniref:ribosomal maturation YjgA family protein n=1 Tax=Tamlana sedimenti TaxID=3134126 RepID=UPI0031241BBD